VINQNRFKPKGLQIVFVKARNRVYPPNYGGRPVHF